jgi:FtsP/CotA-like multicopper oxidase with cupredoxin domain
MEPSAESTRRAFLLGGPLATAGALTAVASPAQAEGQPATQKHEHKHEGAQEYPRDHAGPGGPVGSPTDRGKLVAGRRSAGLPPVPVETPDLPNNLAWKMVKGAKEFHLHAQPVKRELLPGAFMNHWGYNGTMPGPTIQVTEGDRVRIVLHNELPEATSLHLHGLELPNVMDGVPYLTQDPIQPGGTGVYELTRRPGGPGSSAYPSPNVRSAAQGVSASVVYPPWRAYPELWYRGLQARLSRSSSAAMTSRSSSVRCGVSVK